MKNDKPEVTRLEYCQYLLSTQINYTLTHFAEHSEQFSHDAVNRYLAGERITPRLVWEQVKGQVAPSAEGYLLFDDTVLDKRYAKQIELARRQYSGNAHGIIRGIGVVTCVYVNPALNQFWLIDYRIYDPEGDGKSKLDHVQEMLRNVIYHKQLPLYAVLMDSWYATKDIMLAIEQMHKVYYCPLKDNRQVDDSGATAPYRRVDSLDWSARERRHGKLVKLKGFPKEHKVKLFRVVLSPQRTEYIVTNDAAQNTTSAAQQASRWRWKIEQFHRESKQLTGLEKCQCRKARIVRNHIGCAFLVWLRLKQVATATQQTIYQVKHNLLSDYLRCQLKSPSVHMLLA
jgi:hypothetical protein